MDSMKPIRNALARPEAIGGVEARRNVRSRMKVVTNPAYPGIGVSARPIPKGGVMMGSTVRRRSAFLNKAFVRVVISANARPMSVVPVAVQTAGNKVRQVTPQLPEAVRHRRLQICGSPVLRAIPVAVKEPSNFWNAPANVGRIG
ncbi:hypothetical protein [Jannaschia rubra]|uniref:hypothetical protein n=1 Tax=Jannaschia rubra TaxID=282197 RepID=UPI001F4728B3|nr:hypothetical protein [Jannaschia rubra]